MNNLSGIFPKLQVNYPTENVSSSHISDDSSIISKESKFDQFSNAKSEISLPVKFRKRSKMTRNKIFTQNVQERSFKKTRNKFEGSFQNLLEVKSENILNTFPKPSLSNNLIKSAASIEKLPADENQMYNDLDSFSDHKIILTDSTDFSEIRKKISKLNKTNQRRKSSEKKIRKNEYDTPEQDQSSV